MFFISSEPIKSDVLSSSIQDENAGALVVFEGRVRKKNQGREVQRLEYEAYETLCHVEFQKIMDEAIRNFSVLEMSCVHRVGILEVGELAVWLGVLAVHRKEAFLACEYGIQELKKRLPIWKKEFYTEGAHDFL